MESTEEILKLWNFHCEHCSGVYDIDKTEIYGYPEDTTKLIICEGCYYQLTGKKTERCHCGHTKAQHLADKKMICYKYDYCDCLEYRSLDENY